MKMGNPLSRMKQEWVTLYIKNETKMGNPSEHCTTGTKIKKNKYIDI